MKKFFILFVASFMVGSIFAADLTVTYEFTAKTWTATLNEESADWTSGGDGYAKDASKGVQVTTAVSGANATCPTSYDNIKKVVVTYSSTRTGGTGSVEIKIGSNDSMVQDISNNKTNQTLEYNYGTPQSGAVKLTVNCSLNSVYVKSVAITYVYNSVVPEILANKLDLGTRIIAIGDAGFATDETISVTGANLTEGISVTCESEYVSVTESSLSADGGTLHLHIATVAAAAFADTIYLTSGAVETKVPVVAKIKKNVALLGTDVSINDGTTTSSVNIDGISGKKVGTSTNDGNLTITIPAYTTNLRFYAVAWAENPGTILLSAPDGVGLSTSSLTLLDDAGVSGSTSTIVLDALTHAAFAQEITLTGVDEEKTITIASGTARRFILWGAKCDLGYVVNYLDKAGDALANDVIALNLPEAPVVSGFTFLYWKAVEGNIAAGINIQAVYQADEPTEAPAVVVDPANPSQKLIREGNVYILYGDQQYNLLGTRIR